MRKLFAFISAFALLCASVPVLPARETAVITANAYEKCTYEIFKYYKYEDYIKITGVTVEKDTIIELNIPAEIDGLPVTEIGIDAFRQCRNLTSVTISDSITGIGAFAFSHCTSLTSITLPKNLIGIGTGAFKYCTNLTSITIPENVAFISNETFINCSNLTSIEISENNPFYTSENTIIFNKDKTTLVQYYPQNNETEYIVPDTVTSIEEYAFCECNMLKSIVLPDNVTNIGNYAFFKCSMLSAIILPDSITSIGSQAFYGCSLTLTIKNPDCEIYDADSTISRDCLIYGHQNSTAQAYAEKYQRGRSFIVIGTEETTSPPEPVSSVSLTAEKHSVKVDTISKDTNSPLSSIGGHYNNGFRGTDTVQELQDASGNIYALCGYKDAVTLVSESNTENSVLIQKEGFTFGGATIDENNHLFILWGYSIPEEEIETAKANDIANLTAIKYDLQGNTLGECGIPISTSRAQYPFEFGNANLLVKDKILGCLFDTEWTKSTDGLNHQGAEFAAINAETMELIEFSTWEGSHSFGVSMIPTEYGFAAIQMGDAYARGINFNSYYASGEEFKNSYLSSNGKTVLYHSSGDYSTNAHHLDGNATYTHMGGLAKAKTTYAVAGKSERVYTSDVYGNSDLRTDVYDVFVKIVDESLAKNVVGLAGEDRIDQATGEIADRNVVWLTECNETEKAGQVKVVTLEDNTYCVLWDKFINDKFDSVHYVILDECGNLLQQESVIKNAKLSSTSIQPIVQGNTLTWAVAEFRKDYNDDSQSKKILTFYQADLSKASSENTFKLGDATGDGEIDILDVITVNKTILGKETLTDAQLKAIDFNQNGKPDSAESLTILKYIVGLIQNFTS